MALIALNHEEDEDEDEFTLIFCCSCESAFALVSIAFFFNPSMCSVSMSHTSTHSHRYILSSSFSRRTQELPVATLDVSFWKNQRVNWPFARSPAYELIHPLWLSFVPALALLPETCLCLNFAFELSNKWLRSRESRHFVHFAHLKCVPSNITKSH